MARIPSTPTPTTPTERKKTPPSTPTKTSPSRPRKSSPTTPKPDDTEPVKKAKGGAKEVEAKKSVGESVGSAVGKAIEDGINGTIEVASKAGKKAAEIAKPIVEPTIREVKEAGREIGDAATEYGKGFIDSLNPLDGVDKIWKDDDLSVGGKIGGTVGKVIENGVVETLTNVKNLANLGKEVVEGAVEITLNSPGINALKEAGKGLWHLGGIAAGWVGDRISGGAKGAVEAGKTSAETGSRIWERSVNQAKENAYEIGEAASDFGKGFIDSLNPLDGVSEIWNSGDSVGARVGGVVGKVIENSVVEGAANIVNAGKVITEVGEAAIEGVVTGAKNLGDAVAGGFKAAGDFFGGVFG